MKEIAHRLNISQNTVEEYRKSALSRFGLTGKPGMRQLLAYVAPYWAELPKP